MLGLETIKKFTVKQATGIKTATIRLTNYEVNKNVIDETKSYAYYLLHPEIEIENSVTETFLEAKKRLNVTDDDLRLNYVNFAWITLMSLTASVICFVFLLIGIMKSNLPQILVTSAMMLYFLASSFKYSFRAMQIKKQKLISASEWWRNMNEWTPNPFIRIKNDSKISVKLVKDIKIIKSRLTFKKIAIFLVSGIVQIGKNIKGNVTYRLKKKFNIKAKGNK